MTLRFPTKNSTYKINLNQNTIMKSFLFFLCAATFLHAQENYWREQNLKRDADANARQRQQDIDNARNSSTFSSTGSWDKVGSNINNYLKEKQQAEAERAEEREESERAARAAEKLRSEELNNQMTLTLDARTKSPYYTVNYTDGSVYVGQMFAGLGKGKGDKKNGKGKLTFSNGEYFEGEFSRDMMYFGTHYFPNGDVWEVRYPGDEKKAFGTFKYKNGSIYEGPFELDENTKKYKRKGKGTLTLGNGTKIESFFDGDDLNTYAKIKYGSNSENGKRGDVYEGQVKNNLKHGRGKYSHTNGTVDDGYWVKGQYIGENPPPGEPKRLLVDELKEGLLGGAYYMAELSETDGKFVGRMFDNKKNGKGTIKYYNGNTIEGEWRNDILVKGTLKGDDGNKIYEGGFKDGLYHYYGSLYDKRGRDIKRNGYWVAGKFVDNKEKFEKLTGSLHYHAIVENGTYYYYTGEATSDKIPHGKGRKYKDDESYSYEGDFVNGKANGKGTEIISNIDNKYVYVGDFVNGNFQGKGKIVWSNGNSYEGDFVQSFRSGKGIYTWTNGEIYEGDYNKNERTGTGKYIWANGDVYEGDFKNAERTGFGKYTWQNGDVYEGQFVKNKIEGNGKKTYKDGKVESGTWVNNVFKGK